jgi:hypothetical protein
MIEILKTMTVQVAAPLQHLCIAPCELTKQFPLSAR